MHTYMCIYIYICTYTYMYTYYTSYYTIQYDILYYNMIFLARMTGMARVAPRGRRGPYCSTSSCC